MRIYTKIAEINPGLLGPIGGRSGVYAIFTAGPKANWTLKYIGQSAEDGVRQRVRSHLVWRNRATPSGRFTGSQFDNVCEAVANGKHIGFSFVEVAPASLRHYVETELIGRYSPSWNLHGARLQSPNVAASCRWHRDS